MSTLSSFSARTRLQRGLAIVETTVAMPLLLLLLMAVGEFGHAMYQYNTLEKTVRDAARYMSDHALAACNGAVVVDISNLTSCGVATTTRNLAVYGAPSDGAPALLPDLTTGDVSLTAPDPAHVRVEVTYDYEPLFLEVPTFGLSQNNIAPPVTFTVATTMRAM